jgi:hypothetical protein
MSGPDRMDPLERRYRTLLRLLPADHRAARGEELLGLLLDLDAGRDRPSVRQASGVVGLAVRLRLAEPASLLLAAFLVASSTAISALFCQIVTGDVTVTVADGSPIRNLLMIPTVLRLAVVVAWVLGRRRTALVILAGLFGYTVAIAGPGGIGRLDLVFLVLLGIAVTLRLPTPPHRRALLAAIPIAILLWTLVAAGRLFSDLDLVFVTVVVALCGPAVGLLRSRR